MIAGFTYDARSDYRKLGYSEEQIAEFDRDETIDALEGAIRDYGVEVERIGGLEPLTRLLAAGRRWDFVFNICEGMYGLGREAAVPALLDAYRIPYVFSGPLVFAVTLHKGMTKTLIRATGIPTADFWLVEQPGRISHIPDRFPLFAKPVAEGSGKGVSPNSVIHNREQLDEVTSGLVKTFSQPALVEKYLSGAEYTAGIIGNRENARVIGVNEVLFGGDAESGGYTFLNKINSTGRIRQVPVTGALEEKCVKIALGVWHTLGCRDSGRVDIRADENGEPHFLEINPLAEMNPVDSEICLIAANAGMSYRQFIHSILDTALLRMGLKK